MGVLTVICELRSDWSQFFPSLLATLFGFFLAIVFQQIVYEKIKDAISDRNKARKLLTEIKKELEKVKKELENIEEKYYLDPIQTPVWDGILNANEIQYLTRYKEARLSKKYLKASGEASEFKKIRINLYDIIFSVYASINEYNKWWDIYSERWASNNDSERLKDVKGSIDNLRVVLSSENPTDFLNENVVVLSRLIECVTGIKENEYDVKEEWIKKLGKEKQNGARSK